MAVRRRLFESERSYRRRQAEERRRKRGQRKRKKANPVDELLKMPKRAMRRKVRSMTRPVRNKMRRKIRSRKRAIRKRVFGTCPVCAQPNSPGHRCNVRFTRINARNVSNRLAKQGGLAANRQNPNLWTRQP